MHMPSAMDWKHAATRWQKEVCTALGIPISPKTKVLSTIRRLRRLEKAGRILEARRRFSRDSTI